MNTTLPQWQTEFGADYAIPAAITEAMQDTSWQHDACPTFAPPAQTEHHNPHVTLWAEHPDQGKREMPDDWVKRYMVTLGDGDFSSSKIIIETDNADEAVLLALETFAKTHGT